MLSKTLHNHIKAQTPLLYLIGTEEQRYLHMVKQKNHAVYTWTATQGLSNNRDDDLDMPVNLLKYIKSPTSPDGVYFLFDFHHYFDNPMVVRHLREVVQTVATEGGKTVIITAPVNRLPEDIEKECTVIEAPLPTAKEIYNYLSATVSKLLQAGLITRAFSSQTEIKSSIMNLKGLTLHQIDQVLSRSITERGKIDPDFILQYKTQTFASSKLLTIINTDEVRGLNDVGGLDVLKKWLSLRKPVFIQRPLKEKNDISLSQYKIPYPKGVLLTGVQGCGKSYISKAIAKEWNVPLLWLDMGSIFHSRVGKSEEQLRLALKTAESMEPCVLLVDELEKGFAGIQSSGLTDGGTSSRVIGYFLSWMQERNSRVFIVATTNDVQTMPPEIMRKGRFDELFFVDLPTNKELEAIFAVLLLKHNLRHLITYKSEFARRAEGFSGTEAEQVIVNALYKAYAEQALPEYDDIMEMIAAIVPLSVTKKDEIENLRKWADGTCLSASSPDNAEKVDENIIDFTSSVRRAGNDD